MRVYHVYVDYRLDTDRPFYVGIGTLSRVKHRWRNEFHDRVVRKHGFRREIVLETKDYAYALEQEIRLIRAFRTHKRDGGTNLTDGGEGSQGRIVSDTTRQRISARLKGQKTRAILCEKIVKRIRKEHDRLDFSVRGTKSRFTRRWAKKLGVTGECIHNVVKRVTWADVP